ncbi:MAG: queuosine salvage family protein [Patescibacteria group bacterium]
MIEVKKVGLRDLLPSTEKVMQRASCVKINNEQVLTLARKIPEFSNTSHAPLKIIGDELKNDLQLIFIKNAVNFSFWPDVSKRQWVIEEKEGESRHTRWGADALSISLDRALKSGTKVLSPNFLNTLTEEQVKYLFRGFLGTEIPMVHERLLCLKNIGFVLIGKFRGKYQNVVEEADYDAVALVDLIAENFSSYFDTSRFRSMRVPFLKRAQLCAYHTHKVLRRYGESGLKNISELTAFADYRVPQVLREFGVLEYSPYLAEKIRKNELIERDDPAEVQIRAATVRAVELIRELHNGKYTPAQIDSVLWGMTRKMKFKEPFHRTRTIAY